MPRPSARRRRCGARGSLDAGGIGMSGNDGRPSDRGGCGNGTCRGPPAGAPDVDCSDLSVPVWVGPDDPHRLDRDGDGIGCESG